MHLFIQLLIQGVEHGAIYGLWALAYALVHQVLGLMNFAFGDMLLFVTYVIVGLAASEGFPIWAAILVGFCLAALAFMALERFILRGFVRRKQVEMGFIAAIGCAYLFRNGGTVLLGNFPVAFPTLFPNSILNVAGLQLATDGLIVLAITAVVLAAFAAYLHYSRPGRGIMLVGQDSRMAGALGVPVRRVVTGVYAVSGLLGLVGMILFADVSGGVSSDSGFYVTFQAFIAATVGGAGSLGGAVAGGLSLGVIEALSVGYISGNFSQALAWLVMALVVLFRPRGLFGRLEVARV